MDMVNKELLRPIGTIFIAIIGLLSILISFNKYFIAFIFLFLIFDSVSAINLAKKRKK